MRAQEPARKDGPRINEEIRVREVHLIEKDGTNKGTVPIADALAAAQEAGLDLVEISPNANPPIVKILDYGKYKYQEQKKAAEARKKQKVVEVKELKYRPMIDDHDYDVKMRAMARFFEEGDKVKITLRFRGREMAHQELGTRLGARAPQRRVCEAHRPDAAPPGAPPRRQRPRRDHEPHCRRPDPCSLAERVMTAPLGEQGCRECKGGFAGVRNFLPLYGGFSRRR